MSSNDHPQESIRGVELPVPTAWPITTALGLTLIAFGLVTNLFVSLVGLVLTLAGAIGWFRNVFPEPQHEIVPLVAMDRRAEPIKFSDREIKHLALGEGGHRSFYPLKTHRYRSGILGGLVGGLTMAVLALLYGIVAKHSIWYPINLLAAAGVPSLAYANLGVLQDFNAIGLVVAIISHGALSILIGLLYTVLLPMLPPRFEWFWGGIITPLFWTALIYPVFYVINPNLAQRVDWLWFVLCQISFGVVGGYVIYKSQKVETMRNWSLAERIGMHAMEGEKKT
jgi:hypothetical protein